MNLWDLLIRQSPWDKKWLSSGVLFQSIALSTHCCSYTCRMWLWHTLPHIVPPLTEQIRSRGSFWLLACDLAVHASKHTCTFYWQYLHLVIVSVEKQLSMLTRVAIDWSCCHSREDQPRARERIGEESKGDAVTVYHAAGGRPVPVQPVGHSQQHVQGI